MMVIYVLAKIVRNEAFFFLFLILFNIDFHFIFAFSTVKGNLQEISIFFSATFSWYLRSYCFSFRALPPSL